MATVAGTAAGSESGLRVVPVEEFVHLLLGDLRRNRIGQRLAQRVGRRWHAARGAVR